MDENRITANWLAERKTEAVRLRETMNVLRLDLLEEPMPEEGAAALAAWRRRVAKPLLDAARAAEAFQRAVQEVLFAGKEVS